MVPLIVITGPTASGKSGLALSLAERWGGEIICADSRTIYTGMDVGTAKPSLADRSKVPHHLLDMVEPGGRFTVADFQKHAQLAIAEIRERGKVPIMVGGSGLYVDSIVLDYEFGPDVDPNERQQLEAQTVDQLVTLLQNHHIALPENAKNKRYLIRAFERRGQVVSSKTTPDHSVYVVALTTDSDMLKDRIRQRIEIMFASGAIEEAQRLANQYGWECEAMTGNIYAVIKGVLTGSLSRAEAIERSVVRDLRLVKRQITWLKRRPYVQWLGKSEAEEYFDSILREYRDSSAQ